jgi:hypothetical protein
MSGSARALWMAAALLVAIPACLLTAPSEDEVLGGCDVGAEKECNGKCVAISDPAFGCGTQGCTACSVEQGSAACQDGICVVAQCQTGFDDCNELPDDGCEANLANDPDNCSQCKHACSSGLCQDAGCCKALGEVCGSQVECCGNDCNGKCCASNHSACDTPADCCQGVCTNNLCCKGSGTSCGEDKECCSDKCGSGTCQ